MADILCDLPIRAPIDRVFAAISTPEGLDTWWSKRAEGTPEEAAVYKLSFGPGYDWRARVIRYAPPREFELEILQADGDWLGTRVGFRLAPRGDAIWLQFSHSGWPSVNEHYRISCNCWAMYLRVLRRSLEYGESVPYESRLEV